MLHRYWNKDQDWDGYWNCDGDQDWDQDWDQDYDWQWEVKQGEVQDNEQEQNLDQDRDQEQEQEQEQEGTDLKEELIQDYLFEHDNLHTLKITRNKSKIYCVHTLKHFEVEKGVIQ